MSKGYEKIGGLGGVFNGDFNFTVNLDGFKI